MTDKPSAPSSESEFLSREFPAASPQRDMLLKLLDSEVSLLTQKQKNSGWTNWALVGAISAIALILLEQWEAGWPMGEKWLLAYFAITFTGYALLALVGILKGGSSKLGGITRFHLGSQGNPRNARVVLSFSTIQSGGWCALLCWSTSFSFQTRVVAGALTGLTCLFSILALLLAFTQIPVTASAPKEGLKPSIKAIVVLVILFLFFAPVIMTGRDLLGLAPTALDIKIGGLCAAAGFLVRAWLQEVSNEPLIDNLLLIRRELVLGGMSIEEASRHLEIEFLGMRVSDVFRDSAQEFLKHAARITARCKESIARIDAIELLAPIGAGVPVSLAPQKMILAQTMLEAHQPHLSAVIDELKQLESRFQRIESRSRFFLNSEGDAQAAMHEILARLKQGHFDAYNEYQELERRMNQLSTLVVVPTASNGRGAA